MERRCSKALLATYISWTAVRSKLVHASTPFQHALLQLRRKLYGVVGDVERWQKCTEFSDSALGFATGALYVDKYFSETDRLQVKSVSIFILILLKNFTV